MGGAGRLGISITTDIWDCVGIVIPRSRSIVVVFSKAASGRAGSVCSSVSNTVVTDVVDTADSGASSYSPMGGDPAVGKLPGIPKVGESKGEEGSATDRRGCGGIFVVILSGSAATVRSVGLANSRGRLMSLDGDGTALMAVAAADATAAAMPVTAASASSLTFADISSSFRLRSAAACRASLACESRMDLLYASLMVSRRCAKSMGPSDSLRLRSDASSPFVVPLWEGFVGDAGRDAGRDPAFILEAEVVAVATDCRGRELRRPGESLGVESDT